jgi:hypothetical protein
MEISIDWQKPVQLTRHKRIIVDKDDLPEAIEARAGVYFFARRFGRICVPFYIGETLNIRSRLKQHLGTVKIADVLRSLVGAEETIKIGVRYFHFGYIRAQAPTKQKRCLKIVQKYLIRQAVENEIAILNTNLKKFKTHDLLFEGSKKARAIYSKANVVEAE